MVRPAVGEQRKAPRAGDVVVLSLDSLASGGEHALGSIRAADRHRVGQHAGKRRGQFLRSAQRPARDVRDHLAGLPRHVDHVRPLPQPSARKMDKRSILRDGKSVLAAESEKRRWRGEPDRLPDDGRRAGSAADRPPAASSAARRRGDPAGRDGRSPAGACRLAHGAGESVLQPRDHQSRLGELPGRGPGRGGR